MNRRELLQAAPLYLAALAREGEAPEIGPGPHLLFDDVLVARDENLLRVVHPPQRLPRPVLDSRTFGVTQPYLSVVRDGAAGRFRIWYNHGPAVWHAQSDDGIRWTSPRVSWELRRAYGASVIDDRGRERDPARRFKLANWQSNHLVEDTPRDMGGMYVGFSPDGFRWTPSPENPVLRTYPTGWPRIEKQGVGDTIDAFWDPIHSRYAAAVKVHAVPEDNYSPGPKAGRVFRRLVGMTTSRDFVDWEAPRRILVPEPQDEGLLEFYGMGAVHARGPLLIGCARVLRDDLPCDPGGPKDGIGYSVLAWSRDGVHWERDRVPFFERAADKEAWDHAVAWISDAVPVGDEVYFYYGGYQRGHKIAPERERQIGLARMRKDRYVSRSAGSTAGLLRTNPFAHPGGRLRLNLRAPQGRAQVRVIDPSGRAVSGFDWKDASPVSGDSLELPLHWKGNPRSLRGKTVCLEFRLTHADLFAFEFLPVA